MTADERAQDAVLVTRARLGDRAAFEELIDRYLPALHDHVARLSGDPTTDPVVRIFDHVVARLGSLRDPEQFRTWLYSLAGEELAAVERGAPPVDPELTSEQRSVQRVVAGLPLDQARALDLAVRRGFDQSGLDAALGKGARRSYDRAVGALQSAAEHAVAVYASLPPYDPHASERILERVAATWSAEPPTTQQHPHHGLVVWGAAAAAVLLAIAVPAAAGIGPAEREVALTPVEYTAAPFVEAAGVPPSASEEPDDEVLPSLPTFELEEPSPEPEPSPSDTRPAAEPSPSPEPDLTPTPPGSPTPTPTEDPCVVDLDLVCPSESPSPAPEPTPTATEEPTSQEEGGAADESDTQAGAGPGGTGN